MNKILSVQPELKMAELIQICKKFNSKSATDVLNFIQKTYKDIGTEQEPKIIVEDVVTLTEIAWNIAYICTKDELSLDQVKDELSDFKKVQQVISWATTELINVMNPPKSEDPN